MISHRAARPQSPARTVVIGARGFVGKGLMERLRAQQMPSLGLGSSDIDLVAPASVDELCATLRPTDAVVMLSALTPDRGRDVGTLMKNLAMMQHLCAALAKTGCAHLVYFSSDAVYSFAGSRVTEETPATPPDLYGAMHYVREAMAHALVNVPVLVLRPTLIYGANDTHNAYGPNRFRRAAEKDGRIQLFGGGEETRDHIHVDDVAELTLRCLCRGSTGTLNLATGRSLPFHRVAEIVAREFPKRIEIVSLPRSNPLITHRHYDVTSVIKAFPDYRFISLEEGVARYG